jgi:hypothetical protein
VRISDLVEQLRGLDPEMEVNATITSVRFMTDDEAAACRRPDGKWKPDTMCCKATGRPVTFVSVPLDWRSRERRAADKASRALTPNEAKRDCVS